MKGLQAHTLKPFSTIVQSLWSHYIDSDYKPPCSPTGQIGIIDTCLVTIT